MVKGLIKRAMASAGFKVVRTRRNGRPAVYDNDGLISTHNREFMDDPDFRRAYARGVKAAGQDYGWYWRVHIGLWAAYNGSRIAGDFVECGVHHGFLSSAVMEYLNWNATGRTFHLLDTFGGLDEQLMSAEDVASGGVERNRRALASGTFTGLLDKVRANFAEWQNVNIVPGRVPDTLPATGEGPIAYLHIDMNCSPPEVAAFDYFWDRLSPGAVILLDDYAYGGFASQKHAMDAATAAKGIKVASLPTGQGIIIKP